MRDIKDILTEIDSKINIDAKFYGLSTLQTRDEKTFPIVNTGNGQGKQISFKDSLAIYHRIISSKTDTDPTKGKGKYPYQSRTYTMRLVGLGDMRKSDYDTNDKIKNEVYDQLPVILSDKEIIKATNENVDRTSVLSEELNGYDFQKLNLDMIAFYIEYEIKQRICPTKI